MHPCTAPTKSHHPTTNRHQLSKVPSQQTSDRQQLTTNSMEEKKEHATPWGTRAASHSRAAWAVRRLVAILPAVVALHVGEAVLVRLPGPFDFHRWAPVRAHVCVVPPFAAFEADDVVEVSAVGPLVVVPGRVSGPSVGPLGHWEILKEGGREGGEGGSEGREGARGGRERGEGGSEGREGARERGSEGARERGSEGARERGREGRTDGRRGSE